MATGPAKIEIPRWIQLVGRRWRRCSSGRWRARSLTSSSFLVAALIALLLDPLVRALGRLRFRVELIAVVYLSFAALVIAVIVIGAVVVDQSREAGTGSTPTLRSSGWTEQSDGRGARRRPPPGLAGRPRPGADRRSGAGQDFVDSLRDSDPQEYTSRAIDFLEGAAPRSSSCSSASS